MCASSCAPSRPTSLPAMRDGHDDAVFWRCLFALLGEEDDADPELAAARRPRVAAGSFGRPAAYWFVCLHARCRGGGLCLLDGKAALLGTMYMTVCAPHTATPNLARGAKVGSITVPAPRQPTFEKPSCCLYTLQPPACISIPGHAAFAVRAARSCVAQCHPERDWLPSAARRHARSLAAAAAVALCCFLACRSTDVAHRAWLRRCCRRPCCTTKPLPLPAFSARHAQVARGVRLFGFADIEEVREEKRSSNSRNKPSSAARQHAGLLRLSLPSCTAPHRRCRTKVPCNTQTRQPPPHLP